MFYKIKTCRFIDLVKIDEKQLLAVAFEFAVRNGNQKWVIERDWRDIEAALGSYIEQKKHLLGGHRESLDVSGDIQLDITNTKCSSYVHKIFDEPSKSLHSIQLYVIVKYGGMQEKYMEAIRYERKEIDELHQNGRNDESFLDSGLLSPINCSPAPEDYVPENKSAEKYVPQSTTTRTMGATYTPSKKINTCGFEEYVPSGIPADTANQYRATKRKRRDKITPDVAFESLYAAPKTPEDPHANSSPTKRSNDQGSTKTNDLFGPEDSDTDMDFHENVQENPPEIAHNDFLHDDWTLELPEDPQKDHHVENHMLATSSPRKRKKEKKSRRESEKYNTSKSSKISAGKNSNMTPLKNCHHIPIQELLESFALVEMKMKKVMKKFHKDQIIPIIKDFDFTKYADIINKDQIRAAMNFLDDKFRDFTPKNAALVEPLMKYVLPEWMMLLFMMEHKMDRNEAVRYFIERDS